MTSVCTHRPVEAFVADPEKTPLEPEGRSQLLQTQNLDAIVDLATDLHRAGNLREAEAVYLRVLETEPQHPRVVHQLGVACHQLGDDDRALRYLKQAADLDRGNPDLLRHLGEAYRALHHLDDAVRSFEAALELRPDDADSMSNLGHAYVQGGRFAVAESFYRRALASDDDDVETLTGLAVALTHQDRADEADGCYRRALDIDPENEEALHMRAALVGQTPPSASPEYVASLFDRYAASFDRHLVETLRYDVPRLLRSAVERVGTAAPGALRILDLGCGTGLCGAVFHDLAATLSGIDLSPRMIEKSRERGVYDTLMTGDLLEAIEARDEPADLVLAADVFVYVGDLTRVFDGVARVLAPGGLFAFSVERIDDGFALRPSGRYAHAPAYIRDLADRNELAVIHQAAAAVRLDQGRDVDGLVYVLGRE